MLYVALTRARDRLFLTAASRDPARMLGRLGRDAAGRGRPHAAGRGRGGQLCRLALHGGAGFTRRRKSCAPRRRGPTAAGGDRPGSLTARLVKAPGHPEGEAPGARPASRTAAPDPALLAALQRHFAWHYPREALLAVPAKVSVSSLVHAERNEAETPLRRPSFMYSSGLLGPPSGAPPCTRCCSTPISPPRAAIWRPSWSGWCGRGRVSEVTAASADRAALEAFFHSSADGADALRRPPAARVRVLYPHPGGQRRPRWRGRWPYEPVLVQGVADCVIEKDGELFLVDYKTDRHRTPEQLRDLYAPQLALYREALQRRLGLPVARCSLYAFALGREIEVF